MEAHLRSSFADREGSDVLVDFRGILQVTRQDSAGHSRIGLRTFSSRLEFPCRSGCPLHPSVSST